MDAPGRAGGFGAAESGVLDGWCHRSGVARSAGGRGVGCGLENQPSAKRRVGRRAAGAVGGGVCTTAAGLRGELGGVFSRGPGAVSDLQHGGGRVGGGIRGRMSFTGRSQTRFKDGFLSTKHLLPMGNLKKKRRLQMNKHKRRKRLKSNRHKKRTWQK